MTPAFGSTLAYQSHEPQTLRERVGGLLPRLWGNFIIDALVA
jgi:hypothetical protein